MTNTIVTISRQYGSGGREVGKKLAEKLGVPFYDNELITLAAKKSGYAEGLFEEDKQWSSGSLLYSLSLYGNSFGSFDLPLNDKVYMIQSNVIREVAQKGGCVIVGRCADYVLRDFPRCVNVFIHSDLARRMDWAIREADIPADKARDTVLKIDKRRSTYYNFYTSSKFGEASNYDLCVNSGTLGIAGTVEVIRKFIELKDAVKE